MDTAATVATPDDVTPVNKDTRLDELAVEIKEMIVSDSRSAFQLGKLYSEANTLTENKKSFTNWVSEHTSYSRGHAYNYIHIYERFDHPKRLHLIEKIDKTGLMMLAKPRLLDEDFKAIVKAVIKKAGTRRSIITSTTVKECIREIKPPKAKAEVQYEDEETRLLVEKVTSYKKAMDAWLGALRFILEQEWTPESFIATRQKALELNLDMPYVKEEGITGIEEFLDFLKTILDIRNAQDEQTLQELENEIKAEATEPAVDHPAATKKPAKRRPVRKEPQMKKAA